MHEMVVKDQFESFFFCL